MATIASLVIAISANTDAMTGGFSKSEKDYQKWLTKFDQRAQVKLDTETANEQLDAFAKRAVSKMVGIAAAIGAAMNFTKSLADAMEKAVQTGQDVNVGAMAATAVGEAIKGVPILGDLTRMLAAGWDQATGFADELQRLGEIEAIIASNKLMLDRVNMAKGAIADMQSAARWAMEFASATDDSHRARVQFGQDLENIKTRFDAMHATIAAMGSFMPPNALQDLEAARTLQMQAAEASFQHARAIREQAESQKALADATQAADEAMRQQDAIMARGQQIFQQTRTPLERFGLQLEELQNLLDQGAINWETYQRAVEEASQALDKSEASPARRSLRIGSPAAVERRLSLGGGPGQTFQQNSFSDIDKETKIANKKAEERKTLLTQQLASLRAIESQTNFVVADF